MSPERVLHVASFEESGACTLERVARELRDGDGALLLGPASFESALRRELPSERKAAIGRIARVAGRWPGAEPRIPVPPFIRRAFALAAPASPRLPCGLGHFGATATSTSAWIAHGPRARAFVRRRLGFDCALAGVPDALPPAPAWPEARRARIRRELGLGPREVAVLVACEPAEWIDLSFVARAIGMAIVAGAPLRIVASPVTPRLERIGAFLRDAVGSPAPVADRRAERPWELLPALDGAIVDTDGLTERPRSCRGWRSHDGDALVTEDARGDAIVDCASPLPALWSLACGLPTFAHAALDLGGHAGHPGLVRFDRRVAPLAQALVAFARGVQSGRASSRERNPSAASR